MSNSIQYILSFVLLLAIGILSGSMAAVCFSAFTFIFGILLVNIIERDVKGKIVLRSVFVFSYIFATTITLFQWLGIESDFFSFADEYNDHYKFWLASRNGENAESISKIFDSCIIDNVYLENGGYYFLIELIAYIANRLFDGNCVLLQQLVTVASCILSSIFIYKILRQYLSLEKVRKYTCFFIVFSPLILHSIGIYRDAIIALLYFVLIYLWLCKECSVIVLFWEIAIAFLLYYFRAQHGLFAITFIALSLLSSRRKSKWIYIVSFLLFFVVFGGSILFQNIRENFTDTEEVYGAMRVDVLNGLDSGIGRYVYMLPSPLKEIAQIFFLQLRFPPWGMILSSTNVFYVLVGIEGMLVSIVWFYVFISTIYNIIKCGYRSLPKELFWGFCLLFIFLFLNSSNLDSRRVVCMYPLLYVVYCYTRENCVPVRLTIDFRRSYVVIYMGLCILYFVVKSIVG